MTVVNRNTHPLCTASDCDAPQLALGLCVDHHHARYGEPDALWWTGYAVCSVHGCDLHAKSEGLCRRHARERRAWLRLVAAERRADRQAERARSRALRQKPRALATARAYRIRMRAKAAGVPDGLNTLTGADVLHALEEGRCHYCQRRAKGLTIDHVKPLSLGGTNTPDNIVAACRSCNSAKGQRPPDAMPPPMPS